MSYLHLMRPYILRQRKYNGECQINQTPCSSTWRIPFDLSGLEDALIYCGVYAGNTVEQILEVNTITVELELKMAMEALARLRWLALCDWYTESSTTIVDEEQVETAIECMLSAFERKENTVGSVKTLTTAIKDVVILLEEFEDYNSDNALFVFWKKLH